MKFVLYGNFEGAQSGTDWVEFMNTNHGAADAKCKELGIVIESLYVTLAGPFQFIVGLESPTTDAMLAFQLWYSCQGRGRFESMPAFELDTALAAAAKA